MNRTKPRIAVLMNIAVSTFLEKAFSGIFSYIKEADLNAVFFGLGILSPQDEGYGTQLAFLDMINSNEFDGILSISTTLVNSGAIEDLKDRIKKCRDLPIVSIGTSLVGEDYVIFDNRKGIELIMDHLIEAHNYKRYAYISGPIDNAEAQERYSSFKEKLKSAGIPFDESLFFESNFMTSGGYNSAVELIKKAAPLPDVIVCANDRMALGAWNALKDNGYNVPYDIAVTGFDGEELARTLSHQLTTIRQSFEDIGYRAAKMLHQKILKEPAAKPEQVHGSLRINTSCGCIDFSQRCLLHTDAALPEEYNEISTLIDTYISSGCPEKARPTILSKWQETIFKSLSKQNPVFHLEQLLMNSGSRAQPLKENTALLLQLLYTILKEMTGHSFYTNSFKAEGAFRSLRGSIDDLHNDLIRSCSLRGHDALMKKIMEQCGANAFHLLAFKDFNTIKIGATPVFSDSHTYGGLKKKEYSKGAWFPDADGLFVANMISFGNQRYGYILIDAEIQDISIFDYLRIRFSAIAQDLRNHIELRRLNKDLMREIVAREQTENMLKEEINMRRNAESDLKEALNKVQQLSIQDELTGLYNRRGFLTLAQQQMRYLYRNNTGFYILYIDMDGLKTINDKWGHQDGDIAICTAGQILNEALRDSDITARFGGDEFAAMVNSGSDSSIELIKQRIDEICCQKSEELNKGWVLSMSIGYCYAGPGKEYSLERLLNNADEDLYREKKERKESRRHPHRVDR